MFSEMKTKCLLNAILNIWKYFLFVFSQDIISETNKKDNILPLANFNDETKAFIPPM